MEIIKFKTEKEYFEAIEWTTSGAFSHYKDEKEHGFDSEKGTIEVTVYLQRKSDGKRFTTTYGRGGGGETWVDEMEFVEVPQRAKKPEERVYKEHELQSAMIIAFNEGQAHSISSNELIGTKFAKRYIETINKKK